MEQRAKRQSPKADQATIGNRFSDGDKLSEEEVLRRIASFPARADEFEAAIRESKNRLHRRPARIKLSQEEVIERMESFPERAEELVAAIRESKNRSLR